MKSSFFILLFTAFSFGVCGNDFNSIDSLPLPPYRIQRNNERELEKISFRRHVLKPMLDFQNKILPEIQQENNPNSTLGNVWSESIHFESGRCKVPSPRASIELNQLNHEPALEFLDLAGIDQVDFSNAHLPQLRYLALQANRLKNLEQADFPQLETLVMIDSVPENEDSQSTSPTSKQRLKLPADGFPSLTKLYLEDISILDFDYDTLKGLLLEELVLRSYDSDELDFVTGMPLRKLTLMDCFEVRNLDLLKTVPIETLHMDTFIPGCDYSFLKDLKLRELTITFPTKESFSLEWLRGMPLEKLVICGAGIELGSLQVLQDMPLKELVLTGIRVDDLTPLAKLPLENLMLEDVYILAPGNLDFLEQLDSLKQLYLGHVYYRNQLLTGQFDWSKLSRLPLQTLSLYLNANTSEIDMNADIESLEYLRLNIPQGINPDWKLINHKHFKVLSICESEDLSAWLTRAGVTADTLFLIGKDNLFPILNWLSD